MNDNDNIDKDNIDTMNDNNKLIIGLDEAGRGPVLGPMVIALVKIKGQDLKNFEKLDIKDSKKHSKNRREELFEMIINNYDVRYEILEAKTIDKLMNTINLNKIELMAFTKLINSVLKEEYPNYKENSKIQTATPQIEIYIDACSSNEKAFANQIKSKLIVNDENNIKIIAEHKADENYKIVSAASIIAKVIRDRKIEEYKKIYGEIGSGYPSDKITQKYLANYVEKNRELPEIARKSWNTSKKLLKKIEDKNTVDKIKDSKRIKTNIELKQTKLVEF
ncbi:ribonuclease HII [Methanococcus aeolicus]|uniref:Ribonuclease HII n=1 Tax=Methanococcus aeolicus (strain ATCC BAA-1280 / DSM 17508 / OCM 812 / Nankai-3) TaxID=419665 RepID=RNH2_META3|nr:ribonuclease HII [Methanococcus aeolicus]A6UUM1.1 RecName: Full=Ribonuclease HII; Short=RNase HII [Methanococcus aeolicus Nankai-3]ABR56193.1 ribonuclease HII [Methanococcus aeolicus Nankai-3]UXM84203.1 ribonuclease HII [Methanococcus aeolicus]